MNAHRKLAGLLVAACMLFPSSMASAQSLSKADLGRQWGQAYELQKKGRFADAAALFEKILPSAEAIYGKDGDNTIKIVGSLAYNWRETAQYTRAETLYLRVLHAREAKLGKDDPLVADTLVTLGYLYWRMGEHAKSETVSQRSLQIREEKFGKDHPKVAESLYRLGTAYLAMGQYAGAEQSLQRSLQIYEARPDEGKDGDNAIKVAGTLAYALQSLVQYARAETLHLRVLRFREARFGKDDPQVADTLAALSYLYWRQSQNAKAAEVSQRSLQIREGKFGKDHPKVGESLQRLGTAYLAMGQYAKAEQVFQRGLLIYEARPDEFHIHMVNTLRDLGHLYRHMGQYKKAEAFYLRGVQLPEARLGKDEPHVAFGLNGLAGLYTIMGQYAKAEPLLDRSLRILEAKYGKDHPEVAFTLYFLGSLYQRLGQYAKAEPLFQRSLHIREARLGKDHFTVGDSLKDLAGFYMAIGQHDKAEPLLQRSLRIREAAYGKTHPQFARVLHSQANIAWARQDSEQAIALLQQAVEIFQARFGKDHPETNHAMTRLASFFSQARRSAEAFRTMDRSWRALRIHTAQFLPTLPESEQIGFMATAFDRDFRTAISMALDPALSEENRLRSADWVLNGKSIMHEALVERLLLARDNQAPEAKRVLQELEDVRRQLSRRNLQGPDSADDPAFRKEIAELREREKTLEGNLSTAHSGQRRDPWIDIDGLRQKLPKNAVYVDFLRIAPSDLTDRVNQERRTLPPIYVAWISSRDDETAIVNLGSADKIDAAVREARRELQKAAERIKQEGEIDAEKVARQKLAAVSKLVLEPLLARLKRYDQWVLGPDGNLWLVPWASLPLDAKQYVIEKHTLRCVTSGRDLVLNPLQLDFQATAPVIFADPDFDRAPVPIGKPGENDSKGGSRTLRQFGKVQLLAGTAYEAEAITPALAKLASAAPQRFLEGEATVSAFQKLKGPRILVMSTHGYFLPDQEMPKDVRADDGDKLKVIPGMENPLLRSGLLLAGCNQGSKGQQTGVLTGLEIVGTDLRGTELVVLSACETGLGDVRNGEGVAGLRQAFQLAGAQSVVASLWSIADRETALLMKAFFENVAAGQTRVDALREAQLSMLRQRRDRHGAGHPFFWAAFTVTGR